MSPIRLSLVIPCYNEAASLPALLDRCASLVAHPGIEVVLVDNGSTDSTPALLTELLAAQTNIRSVRVEQNQGYGYGILFGLRAARGELLGWTHADLQTDPSDVLRGLALFDSNARNVFVKGSRFGRPVGDVAFSVGMSAFESLLLQRPLWEINAQPTLFHREFFATWQNPPLDFSLDLYAYYCAKRASFRVRRFSVRFDRRLHGSSHWNIDWSAKLKFIKRTLHFSLDLRRGLSRS